jgi:DNA-binding transcriptional MerR regulator
VTGAQDTYRVDELAGRAGITVDTIRYYQHRGLLPAPERRGREAFYAASHLARLERIKELKEQGLSLETIQRVLDGIHPADAALVAAVAAAGTGGRSGGQESERALSLEEVGAEAGVPLTLLESLVTEGLLVPRNPGADRPFTDADVQAVRAGLVLLDAGVPLSDLLALGHRYTEVVKAIADQAVALFDEHVRQPSRDQDEPPIARDRVLEAFNQLLPAASALVRHNFERELLAAAHRRIEETATAPSERRPAEKKGTKR